MPRACPKPPLNYQTRIPERIRRAAGIVVGCGLAIRGVLDDGGAIGVPQGAPDLFEQIDDGLRPARAKRGHGEGDDAKWGRR